MPIETSCDGCGQHLRVQDVHAGKLARCPACNSIYRVPIPDGVQPQPRPTAEPSAPSPNPLATIPLDDELSADTPSNRQVPDEPSVGEADERSSVISSSGSLASDETREFGVGEADESPVSHVGGGSSALGDGQSLDDRQDLLETAYPTDTERAPASSSPTPTWRMRTPEGTIYGPVPQHEIDDWVREGRVSADCQLSESGGAWFWADQMYPQLRPATSTAPVQPYVAPRTPRSHRLPSDRGAIVLALGIMGWVIVCPFISLAAWIMGASDLRDMNAGRMMRTNMGMTQVGRTLGMLHVILTLLFIFAIIFFGM